MEPQVVALVIPLGVAAAIEGLVGVLSQAIQFLSKCCERLGALTITGWSKVRAPSVERLTKTVAPASQDGIPSPWTSQVSCFAS
jgi:hypothetical protein